MRTRTASRQHPLCPLYNLRLHRSRSCRQLCSSLVPFPRIQSVMASRKVAALAQRMIAPGLSRAALNSVRTVTSRSAGDLLKQLATETPHVEVIRYQHKNVKWTLKHVDYFAEALAIGMLDNGLRAGDVVLSWLPNHFSEQHIIQFACSKAGFILYQLDPALAIQNPEMAKKALSSALEISKANVLFTQDAGNDVNYAHLVEAVIPETLIFNFGDGMPFFTPRYPHLRFPIHVGFDYENKGGMIPIKDILCPTGNLQGVLGGAKIDGKSPLVGQFQMGKDGVPVANGKPLSHDDAMKSNVWPEFVSILNKKYKEVEGVGVVF